MPAVFPSSIGVYYDLGSFFCNFSHFSQVICTEQGLEKEMVALKQTLAPARTKSPLPSLVLPTASTQLTTEQAHLPHGFIMCGFDQVQSTYK
jgi:hypothetical protein